MRSVGEFRQREYHRAYYHANRKGKPRTKRTAAQLAADAVRQKARYHRDLERKRAEARARYWKHRDKYAEASRLRAAARRAAARA